MKKSLILMLVMILALGLTACGASGNNKQAEVQQPVDLTGNWSQVNSTSENNYYSAIINGETIEIYWADKQTGKKLLYWAGSFTAPTTNEQPYTWKSVNDKTKTNTAIAASNDDTKTFTYANNQISYEASAFGITQTVKMENDDTK